MGFLELTLSKCRPPGHAWRSGRVLSAVPRPISLVRARPCHHKAHLVSIRITQHAAAVLSGLRDCLLGCSLVIAPAGQALAASEIRLAQALGSDAPAQLKDVKSVLGIEVRTVSERNVGRIVDLLFEPNGAVEAAVVEFGGFLGIGARKIAIEWSALRFQAAENKLVAILDIPRDQLHSAPDYKPGQPAAIMKGDRPTE